MDSNFNMNRQLRSCPCLSTSNLTCERAHTGWMGGNSIKWMVSCTWVNVVRCLRLAGVGQDAVVGVCPACWGNDEIPLPGDDTPPDNDDKPEFGSGFNFLNAPSAGHFRCVDSKGNKEKWLSFSSSLKLNLSSIFQTIQC